MGSTIHSNVSYILLRLLALIGILLVLERTGNYVFKSQNPSITDDPDYGLQQHAYKDGDRKGAFEHVSTASKKSRAIVAASLRGDNTSWIQEYFPEWESNVYGMHNGLVCL